MSELIGIGGYGAFGGAANVTKLVGLATLDPYEVVETPTNAPPTGDVGPITNLLGTPVTLTGTPTNTPTLTVT